MSFFHHILTEIVAKITIERDFTITHSDYPPLSTSPETLGKLQQLSVELQQKYLVAQVQSYLYDIYFSHSLIGIRELETIAQQSRPIKNNLVDGINIDFYPRLQQSNTSNGYFDPGWEIIAQTDWGELIVVKDGLHLYIEPQQHLAPECRQVAPGKIVSICLPHNLVGQDTYISIGNAGIPGGSELIQIYFNFTPDAAIDINYKLTNALNKQSIPFQFAILHDPARFDRYDGATLELAQSDYQLVQPVLTEIYQVYQATFSPHIPLFSKQLAPGMGLVEVPESDTFGRHRCHILATGLVMAIDYPRYANRERGHSTTTERLNTICQFLANAGIDLAQPYLNPAAIDHYPLLFS
jgi:HopA1 effector protein family